MPCSTHCFGCLGVQPVVVFAQLADQPVLSGSRARDLADDGLAERAGNGKAAPDPDRAESLELVGVEEGLLLEGFRSLGRAKGVPLNGPYDAPDLRKLVADAKENARD